MSVDDDALNDMISQTLDMAPMKPDARMTDLTPLTPIVPVKVDMVKGNTEFETAKGNMENLLEVGTVALNDVLELARSANDPRAYRVLTELITALTSANKELMEIKSKDVDIRKKEAKEDGPDTVNNNLIVGSTADIINLLQGKREKQKIE